MAPSRKILIADPDTESVRILSSALRVRGGQVYYAQDGSRALELAVLRYPDLILFDDACTLIDARTFVSILRSNPRTSELPVLLSTRSNETGHLPLLRDGILQKPYNLDEVLARIEHVLRRTEAARDLTGASREIEGTLGQLGVADVLQILSMNRRSGRLELQREAEKGEVHVGEGRPLNARLGSVEGEKAFFRLLTWAEGSFAFVPGAPASRVRIGRTMDDALLEGMRQKDETERLAPQLPARSTRLQLMDAAPLSQPQHPITAHVLELLSEPRTLGELLDLSVATDLDTTQALLTLLDKGLVRPVETPNEPAAPLLTGAEVHALHARLFRGQSRQYVRTAAAKLLLIGPGAEAFARLRAELPGFTPLAAEPQPSEPLSSEPAAVRSGFGSLGLLALSDGLRLELSVLPLADASRPLWRPFSTGAMGAVLLDTSDAALALAGFLAFELELPLLVMVPTVPAPLERAPAGVVAKPAADLATGLRSLLLHVLQAEPLVPSGSPVRGSGDEGLGP